MIPPPKGMAIGADADGTYSLLYAGPDFAAAQECLEKPDKDLHQIFIFRNGQHVRTRETPTARAIRQAHLDKALEDANAAVKKAADDREKKAKDAQAKKDKAAVATAAKIKRDAEQRELDRLKRNADLLGRAGAKAKQQLAALGKPAKENEAPDESGADSGKQEPVENGK